MRHKRCETCGAWEEAVNVCCRHAACISASNSGSYAYDWCLEWVPKENDPGDVLERCVARLAKLANESVFVRWVSYETAVRDCLFIIEEERNREAKNV